MITNEIPDEEVIRIKNVQICCDCLQAPIIVNLSPEIEWTIESDSCEYRP